MTSPEQLYAQALQAAGNRHWNHALLLALDVLRISPEQAGMHYVAGVSCLELGQTVQAVRHLQFATQLEPERANFAAMHAHALAQAQLPALDEATRAMQLSPKDPAQLMMLGIVFSQNGDHGQAMKAFELVTNLAPNYVPGRFALASSYIFLGETKLARDELEQCLRQDPSFWKAYLARSQLSRQKEGANHVDQLKTLLDNPKDREVESAGAQVCLRLALAKELEDLGRYAEAFPHMVAGKAAVRRAGYSSRSEAELFAAIRQTFNDEPDPSASASCSDDAPIFILGMPRSGTTLVDRIISSHREIQSAGELNSFPLSLKQLSGSHTRKLLDIDTVERSARISWSQLGKTYLAHVRANTRPVNRFIDKLPHNFLYIGAIARALPNARIICLRRHPLDTCLSNLRQLFGEDSPFHDYSYDLLDIGRHYLEFDRLMRHWQHVLPDRVIQVHYEDLVTDQEAVTRHLLAYCGLPWDDACLNFEANSAPVSTASALQVRQPMHRSALGHWRHYENELAPLRHLLVDAGIDV